MSPSAPKSIRRIAILIPAFAAALILVGCDIGTRKKTGGNYSPVTAEHLARAKFSHRTGSQDFDFDWTFQAGTFVIEGAGIPPDLMSAMLGPDSSVERIEGTWQIRDGRIFFVVKAGDAEGSTRECSLPIYSTGVIRIETQDAQYVF
jgi:hypothetical protein